MEARRAYFAARKPERKADLRQQIDTEVLQHIKTCLDFDLEKTNALIVQHQRIVDGILPKPKGWNTRTAPKKLTILENQKTEIQQAKGELDNITHQPERPFFLWHLLFQDVFKDGGFDIVIANPPYVRQELIKEQKPFLQAEGYEVFTGTADLLVYFYEVAAKKLLKPGGTLTFITSNKFYRAGYGEKLRKFLNNTLTLHTLIDFGDAPVFNGVVAYASIVIGTKEKAPSQHEAKALPWDLSKPAIALPIEIGKSFPIAQSSLTSDAWRLVPLSVTNLLKKLRETSTPLGEFVKGKFYRGILTGLNEAFVIDEAKRSELINADPNSAELIKPFLRGRDVKRWQPNHENLYLIFTRRGTDINAFPAIKNHLEHYRTQLEPKPKSWPSNKKWLGRKAGSYEWFEIQDNIAYWQEFEHPKIILPAIESNVHYAIDESGFYSNDKTSIIIHEDLPFIVTILNSPLSWWYTQHEFPSKQNGFYEFKPTYVGQFPIPPHDKEEVQIITELYKWANWMRKQLNHKNQPTDSRSPLLLNYCSDLGNALVYQLYFRDSTSSIQVNLFDSIKTELVKYDKIPESEKLPTFHKIMEKLYDINGKTRASLISISNISEIKTIQSTTE